MKFITNLNGNFRVPYQALIDISHQIQNPATPIKNLIFKPICELQTTNDWINLEALGNPTALRAQELAFAVVSSLNQASITNLDLDVHCSNSEIGTDNLYALLYLAEKLDSLNITFYCENDKHSSLANFLSPLEEKGNIILKIQPYDAFSQQLALNSQAEKLLAARKSLIESLSFHLPESIFTEINLDKATANQLIGYVWTCMKTGAYDISCHILSRALAIEEISAELTEQLFIQLQIVRFLSHQYALVADEPFPDEFKFISKEDAQGIYFLKAYSATLSRNLPVAKISFEKCNINKDMILTDEASLYQLNLHALYLVLSGDTETAFDLEMQIEEHINQHNIDVVGLKYVNFINIARLYKKTQQYTKSHAYYEKAYSEIRGGGYTTSDHIYYNMNLGSLYESMGYTNTALFYWITATIHWLSSSNPYELSWRPRIILCQEKVTEILKPLSVEKINRFLFDKLSNLSSEADISLDVHSEKVYDFITDVNNSVRKESCYIAENIVVYGSKMGGKPLKNDRSSRYKLNHLVSALLKAILNLDDEVCTLIVERNYDHLALDSEEACWAFSTLSGCKHCYHNGQPIHYAASQTLNPLSKLQISLSKVINNVDYTASGLELKYKRSFMNKTLHTPEEIMLVKQLDGDKSLSLEDLPTVSSSLLNNLISKRVVTVSYPGF